MRTKKLFVIYNDDTHFWYSCNVIVNAVQEAFSSYPEVTWCKASQDLSPKDQEAICASSQTSDTFVYLLSDNMIYQRVVEGLVGLGSITFIIPVYGNMTVEFARWPLLSEILKGNKLILLAASHRQCQQLALFVKGATIKKIPYPISSMHFQNLPDNPSDPLIHLVYAGRLMVQKNVFELMHGFLIAQRHNPQLRLHIAGDFHDRGYHLHGIEIDFEGFKSEFQRLVALSEGTILYHGFLGQEQILHLNASSDYVVSMSCYHDEDFGISVAQSLAQGLRPILSDWGGHPEFTQIIGGSLVPVLVKDESLPLISKKHLFLALQGLTKLPLKERLENRAKIQAYLSTANFQKKIDRLLAMEVKPYLGQTDFYLKYAAVCCFWYPFFMGTPRGEIKYLDVYQSYISDYQDAASFSLDPLEAEASQSGSRSR